MAATVYRPEIDTLFIRLTGFGGLHVVRELDTDVYALCDVETSKVVGLQIENWKGLTSFAKWEAKQMQDSEFRAEVKRQERSYQQIRRRVLRQLKWQRRWAAWKQRLFLQA